jgi:hypothetical protein
VGRTKAGAIHNSEFRSIAGSRDAAPQDLVFGAGDDDTVVGFDDDYYAFECDIPGMAEGQASGVVSYRITEQDTFVD